jgi:hypothetical protein
MRRYPVVWYFHTRRPYRSLPYIFWVIGAAAAAVRWGLPDDHPAVSDAWLPALIDGFEDVLEQMAHRFLPTAPPERADPLPFDAFRAALAAGGPEDELLKVFLATEEAVCALAQVSPEEDVARRYERFCEWHRFASRGRAFVRLASRDLGIDLSELYGNPSQRLY